MSTILFTTFACGHEERSSTRIGTERGTGLGGMIRRINSKKSTGPVRADSALFCSACRKNSTPHMPSLRRSNSTNSHKSFRGADEGEPLEDHPHPLRSHPIIRPITHRSINPRQFTPAPESEEPDNDDANPFANKFADFSWYGPHDFTRKHPSEVKEEDLDRETIPITHSLGSTVSPSHPEPDWSLPESESTPKVARQPSKVGRIVREIEKKSKTE
ncbi:hypothetical protein SBOR_5872 [Sclerotinia borealis F-4128]|uniref:Uncharacterized protein n=1 Tax=Sclerotinia borealis (strain F-4128) TaxID=1432307 RepID=W9CGS2_SCLBF|nr:hypothetical protein SBOR_5872 [Sclerotinia borealis F-4128]